MPINLRLGKNSSGCHFIDISARGSVASSVSTELFKPSTTASILSEADSSALSANLLNKFFISITSYLTQRTKVSSRPR